jgi:hypothetical protein
VVEQDEPTGADGEVSDRVTDVEHVDQPPVTQCDPLLEGGYARFVAGGADNPKMEAFGAVVLDMAEAAAELTRTASL